MSSSPEVQNQEPKQEPPKETDAEQKQEEKEAQGEEKDAAAKEEVKVEEKEEKKEEKKEEEKKEEKKKEEKKKKEQKKEEKNESWKDFIYNPRTGEFLGRTASSWGKRRPGPQTRTVPFGQLSSAQHGTFCFLLGNPDNICKIKS